MSIAPIINQISYSDVLFVAIILLSTVIAFFKGMFREIIGIGVAVLGFALAVFYYRIPSAKLVAFGWSEIVADLFGFLGIFLGCILLGTITSLIVDRFLKTIKLKWVDRMLGAIFGFIRGWMLSAVIVLALTAFPAQNNFMTHSLFVPYLLGSAGLLIHLTPDDLKKKFEEHSKQLINYWNRGIQQL